SEVDLVLLSSVINSEAGGESYQEKLRVGNVVLNRVQSKHYPDNIHDVIYQRKQFSGICSALFRYDINGDRGDIESIKAAKALLNGKKVLQPSIIGFFNEAHSTNKKFVARIKSKVVFTSEAHSYFKA
ncbi:cell wall hydrolase, partial [Saprospiraceae bacterium]|nr:cell wall hydrolase [Saprospiraceae bacterium]